MAKKSRPSFDAPKKATGAKPAAAGWVYKSDETAVVTSRQSPVVSPAPVASPESSVTSHQSPVASLVKKDSVPAVVKRSAVARHRVLDSALMTFTLLLMTTLVQVSWWRGKR